MLPPNPIDLSSSLRQFGLSSFRPGQLEVVTQLILGNDCLCVMPTGGGKSLCYQLPAVVRPGLTIVVSPLIALMKDQVDALTERGIPATLINSSLSPREQDERLTQVAQGKYKLLYVAPERLHNNRFLEAIRATPVQLLAIDEAHCISEWGHDFRPDYAKIGRFREWLGGLQTIALTATATSRVRQDILDILKLKNPKQFITGFARTNLHFGSVICHSDRDKDRALVDFLKTKPGFGIIYAATRKRCEALVELVSKELKITVGAYHAGLTNDQRRLIQDRFMNGTMQCIVATNAFGMGIDKANLRYVVHYNIPGSMEAYYQEAGRAGRDGKKSQCVLLFSYQDRYIQEFFIENAHPPKAIVKQVYDFLCERTEDPIELTQQEIREALDLPLSAEAVGTALQILAKTNVIERLEIGGGLAMIRLASDLPTLVDLLPRESKMRRSVLRVVEQAVGDRRHEAVYIHPRWLMQKTEMDREALGRTLRELSALECFEYVPPFRGRAIRFRKRGIPFDKLEIDFEALDTKKKAEYEKLDHVIAYAQGNQCRQLFIVQYFGDPVAKQCGMCDRCQGHSGWPNVEPLPSEPSLEVVPDEPPIPKKNLPSSDYHLKYGPIVLRVLQAIQRTHGRLGKILAAQYLCGSENAKIQRLRLNRLPDFGLLADLRQTEATSLLEALLTVGWIQQREVNRHRPTVTISEAGEAILVQGQGAQGQGLASPLGISDRLAGKLCQIKMDSANPGQPSNAVQVAPVVATSIAPSKTAPSKTAPNKTAQISAASSMAELTQTAPQVSPTPLVIRVDAGHPDVPKPDALKLQSARPNREPEKSMETVASGAIKLNQPDWHWTLILVEAGYSLDQCAAIRRKAPDAILLDLVVAGDSSRRVDLARLLGSDLMAVIVGVTEKELHLEAPPPKFAKMPLVWRLLRALNGPTLPISQKI